MFEKADAAVNAAARTAPRHHQNRFAATEDVAAYLDGLRDQARRAMEAAP